MMGIDKGGRQVHMAHRYRFHVPGLQAEPGETVALPEEEAHHAQRVARVRPGDAVALFDGAGTEWAGRVAEMGKRAVSVAVADRRETARPARRLTLGVAWVRREKLLEFAVRHGTELGVDRFLFFAAARSEKAPRMDPRWERIAVEVCKQSGRLWLPSFEVVDTFGAALDGAGQLALATQDRPPAPLAEAMGAEGDVALLVGPEGDFTEEELAAAEAAGATPVSLGTATLRAEVAAVTLAVLAAYELGRLGPR
jgi:16S rRNA (uracil1498-N3)-methyltransferase